MAVDNWAHRSTTMRCQTCMWWVEKTPRGSDYRPIGRCRHRSPTVKGWPAVFPDDWCGDHKIDETKLPGRPAIPSKEKI